MSAWNPRRVVTFDVVRYREDGVERTLSFEDFHRLSIDGRVRLLLVGKPRFFLGDVEISKTKALARQD